ncbi:MAG TPA: TRAP transporter fused permease subunit [Vicinamibacterales bacterium]|nr:TRAP transporter fused permease subunit [Vicinamibacterales bacterium]
MRAPAGLAGRVASLSAAGLAAYAIYWVLFIVQPQVYRITFLLIALILTLLLYPATARLRSSNRVPLSDWILIALAAVAFIWPLVDFRQFVYRAAEPTAVDLILGAIAIGLVLEAARRAVGWVLPATALAFLLYAWAGPLLDRIGLDLIAHRGYGPARLVGTLYMTLEGVFGVPLDVTATYIVLFTIYGALLDASGAGSFFIEWALRVSGRSIAAPGRSVTIAGFLLGTVSGSGVATTVMLGSVAWPLLRRARYSAETAGAMLSAAGIGALLSPPTLGAAAFLIAEFLQISYLQILVMATIPTVLYYFSILLMIEADARRAAAAGPKGPALQGADTQVPRQVRRNTSDLSLGALTRRYWYHFTSLAAIAVFMAVGMSAFKAVFWSGVLAIALSYLRAETALTPSRLYRVLRTGGQDVLGVAATTATAGIIVGVVTLTGLGLKLAGLIVTLAGGTLTLTVLYSAIAVWLLGLAVPVTASYIIAAVMVAPALVRSGVPDFAAHMFIFYYAVLSEVSPPTALSPFAAAALTGGNPFRTMILTWKYTLPAFVVPFVFTLRPEGAGLLLHGSWASVLGATFSAATGIAALAATFSGWIRGPVNPAERVVLAVSGLLLLHGGLVSGACGSGCLGLVLILHHLRHPATIVIQSPR